MDPYAVNNTLPIGAMAYLRRSYGRLLPRITKNNQIHEICVMLKSIQYVLYGRIP